METQCVFWSISIPFCVLDVAPEDQDGYVAGHEDTCTQCVEDGSPLGNVYLSCNE